MGQVSFIYRKGVDLYLSMQSSYQMPWCNIQQVTQHWHLLNTCKAIFTPLQHQENVQ